MSSRPPRTPGPLPTSVALVRAAVRNACADLSDALVLVACSGGPDSLALAAATGFLATTPGNPWRAGAVIVDHGLQPDSARVAEHTAALCQGFGLDPVCVERVQVGSSGGPEAAARESRYAALEIVAERTGAAAILLGHTLDDQAETVLLGLARGSGTRSLSGMATVRGQFRRPLLGVTRDVVHQAAAHAGTPWQDPHNTDDAYARSRVRHRVLPVLEAELGPGIAQALARTARLCADDADALDELTGRIFTEIAQARITGAGLETDLPVDELLHHPGAIRRRLILTAARSAGAAPGTLTAEHAHQVDALLTDWHGQGTVQLPRVTVTRRYGRLIFVGRTLPEESAT